MRPGVIVSEAREVPFHRPSLGEAEEREVLDTLRSGWLTTGPKVKRFESEFRKYTGARNALAVAHCTAALHLAFWALGLRPGDEVITTPFTFTASAEILGYLGARPLFVDIDPNSLNIDPERIEALLTSHKHSRVRAIEPVHFAGQPCDMETICDIARRHRVKIVEDGAHALGAACSMESSGMRKIGTIGDVTCFSFYATKNVTSAEGGMITTEDDELAEKMAIASLHGMSRDAWKRYDKSGSWYYEIRDTGFKYNLSDVHAAIGLAQLRRAEEFTRRRAEIASQYSEAFKKCELLEVPGLAAGERHAWHLYVLRLRSERLKIGRDEFITALRERGVGTSVHFIPLHTMHFYQRTYGYRLGDFPVSEDTYSRCLSLPIYPAMNDRDVNYVIDVVLDTARRESR